jgi:hypothetical protein
MVIGAVREDVARVNIEQPGGGLVADHADDQPAYSVS